MRHGKAEQAGRTDFERELADRGRHDAEDTGAWLARQGFVPDHALVSAARRTIGTWESVASRRRLGRRAAPRRRSSTAPAPRPPST